MRGAPWKEEHCRDSAHNTPQIIVLSTICVQNKTSMNAFRENNDWKAESIILRHK